MKMIGKVVIGTILSAMAVAGMEQKAQALDLSLVSGVYQQEKSKVDGNKGDGSTTFSATGRAGDRFTAHQGWYGEGGLVLKSYEAGEGSKAPDNYTGLSVGGGYRLYLAEFTKQITPYIGVGGNYKTDKKVTYSGTTTYETTSSGLYYKGFLGLRFDIDRDFFFELESAFFDSPLFATEKVETRTGGATPTNTKRETTKTELFVSSSSAFTSTTIAFGFKI